MGAICFAGTYGYAKILRSIDSGLTWSDIGQGFGQYWIPSFCSVGGGVVLAGTGQLGYMPPYTDMGYILRSIDNGVTWTNLGQQAGQKYINAIIHLGGGVCCAAAYGQDNTNTGHILRSTNSGASWTNLTQMQLGGTTPQNVNCLCVVSSTIALAGTSNSAQLLRTTNGGASWGNYGQKGGQSDINGICYAGGGVCVMGTSGSGGSGKILRSTDYGATWTEVLVRSGGVDPVSYVGNGVCIAGTGYGEILRSTDRGLTWVNLGRMFSESQILNTIKVGGGVCLAGTYANGLILRSTDYGATWVNLGRQGATTSIYGLGTIDEPTVPVAGASLSPSAIHLGQSTTLDGSTSSDAGGTLTRWKWYVNSTASESNVIADVSTPTTSVSYLDVKVITGLDGTYNIYLVVQDDRDIWSTNTATVPLTLLADSPPVANAGGPYAVGEFAPSVMFDGSRSTPVSPATIVSYTWRVNDGSGTILGTGVRPTFTLAQLSAAFGSSTGTHTVYLVVVDSDGFATSAITTLAFLTGVSCPVIEDEYPYSACDFDEKQPPVPMPGGPYEVFKNQNIVFTSDHNMLGLDGSASYDPDGGDLLSYLWSIDSTRVVSTPAPLTGPISWLSLRTTMGYGVGSHDVSLLVVDDDLQVGGDGSNQLSGWSLSNIRAQDMDVTAYYQWYWGLISVTGVTTVSLYKDSAKTQLVARGQVNTASGGVVTLAAQPGSILTGLVTVKPNSVTDVGVENTLYYSQATSGVVPLVIHAASNPIAEVNGPFVVSYGQSVVLDGSRSVSPDSDPLTYSWSVSSSVVPGGPWFLGTGVTLTVPYDQLHLTLGLPNNSNITSPFADYVVTLTVTAGNQVPGDPVPTASASTTLSMVNTAPTPVTVPAYDLLQWLGVLDPGHGMVTLNGAGSFDVDGSIATYEWRLGSGDRLSQTLLASSATATFTWGDVLLPPPSDTLFNLNLWVRDNDGVWASAAATLYYPPNHAPTCSIIGGPFLIESGDSLLLDGTFADVDTYDFTTFWRWEARYGGDAPILLAEGNGSIVPISVPWSALIEDLVRGRTYNLVLTVSDRAGAEGSSSTTLVLEGNQAPVAVITGGPITIRYNESAVLDGHESYDPDFGDYIAFFEWSVVPSGGGATIVLYSGSLTGEPVPVVSLTPGQLTVLGVVPGQYVLSLLVRDREGVSDTASTTLTRLGNQSPVAIVDGPWLVGKNGTVTLDGSASYDPDGDPLTYAWSILVGAVDVPLDYGQALPGSTPAKPIYSWDYLTLVSESGLGFGQGRGGSFVVTLTVSDGVGLLALSLDVVALGSSSASNTLELLGHYEYYPEIFYDDWQDFISGAWLGEFTADEWAVFESQQSWLRQPRVTGSSEYGVTHYIYEAGAGLHVGGAAIAPQQWTGLAIIILDGRITGCSAPAMITSLIQIVLIELTPCAIVKYFSHVYDCEGGFVIEGQGPGADAWISSYLPDLLPFSIIVSGEAECILGAAHFEYEPTGGIIIVGRPGWFDLLDWQYSELTDEDWFLFFERYSGAYYWLTLPFVSIASINVIPSYEPYWVNHRLYDASGGIIINPEPGAEVVCDHWWYDGSGGIIIRGDSESYIYHYVYVATGGITISGSAITNHYEYTPHHPGDEIYVTPEYDVILHYVYYGNVVQGIIINGEAVVLYYNYFPEGGFKVIPCADSSLHLVYYPDIFPVGINWDNFGVDYWADQFTADEWAVLNSVFFRQPRIGGTSPAAIMGYSVDGNVHITIGGSANIGFFWDGDAFILIGGEAECECNQQHFIYDVTGGILVPDPLAPGTEFEITSAHYVYEVTGGILVPDPLAPASEYGVTHYIYVDVQAAITIGGSADVFMDRWFFVSDTSEPIIISGEAEVILDHWVYIPSLYRNDGVTAVILVTPWILYTVSHWVYFPVDPWQTFPPEYPLVQIAILIHYSNQDPAGPIYFPPEIKHYTYIPVLTDPIIVTPYVEIVASHWIYWGDDSIPIYVWPVADATVHMLYTSDGGIIISGEASDIVSSGWTYDSNTRIPIIVSGSVGFFAWGSGGITVTPSNELWVFWNYISDTSVPITIGGEAEGIVSSSWIYDPGTGTSIIVSGSVGFFYWGSGGLSISGSASIGFYWLASGGIIISGEAEVVSSNWTYVSDTSVPIIVSGTIGFFVEGDGGITVNGAASGIVSSSWIYDPGTGTSIIVSGTVGFFAWGDGGIIIDGASLVQVGYVYDPIGGIVIGGSADIGFYYDALGGIIIGGEAEVVSSSWTYYPDVTVPIIVSGTVGFFAWGDGGIIIGGAADNIVSSSWIYDPGTGASIIVSGTVGFFAWSDGGVILGGSAEVYLGSYEWVPWGGIIVSGSVGFFAWGDGGIIISGEADVVSSAWTYDSDVTVPIIVSGSVGFFAWGSGGIIIGGEAEGIVSSSWIYDPGTSTSIIVSGSVGFFAWGDGGLSIGGSADVYLEQYEWVPWGEIIVSGSVGFFVWGDGGVIIGGEAIAPRPGEYWYDGNAIIIVTPDALIHYYYTIGSSVPIIVSGSVGFFAWGSGGLVIGGNADVFMDRWQWDAFGGIIISGSVGFFYGGSGGIVMGGAAIAVNRYIRPHTDNLTCLTPGGYLIPHSCLVRAQVGPCPMTARREYTPSQKASTGQSFYALSEAYVSAMTVCQVEGEYYSGLRARAVDADCAMPVIESPVRRVSFKKVTSIR